MLQSEAFLRRRDLRRCLSAVGVARSPAADPQSAPSSGGRRTDDPDVTDHSRTDPTLDRDPDRGQHEPQLLRPGRRRRPDHEQAAIHVEGLGGSVLSVGLPDDFRPESGQAGHVKTGVPPQVVNKAVPGSPHRHRVAIIRSRSRVAAGAPSGSRPDWWPPRSRPISRRCGAGPGCRSHPGQHRARGVRDSCGRRVRRGGVRHHAAPRSSCDTATVRPRNGSGTSSGTAAVINTCSTPATAWASRSLLPVSSSANTSSRTRTGSPPGPDLPRTVS